MRIRRSSRLILLDEHNRVLLFKIEDAKVNRVNDVNPWLVAWITPGGGLEDGESHEVAVRRELWEETGLGNIELGPLVAVCEPLLDWAGEIVQAHDWFYLARLTAPEVTLANMSQLERDTYRDHRWWSIEELSITDERIIPRGLGDLVMRIIEGDVPTEPVQMD
jgi:8-oxo-dGTP pyrophosphatase MutT (NUDIX family)